MPELFLLFENGNFIELENGTGALLLENQHNSSYVPTVIDQFAPAFGFAMTSYGF